MSVNFCEQESGHFCASGLAAANDSHVQTS